MSLKDSIARQQALLRRVEDGLVLVNQIEASAHDARCIDVRTMPDPPASWWEGALYILSNLVLLASMFFGLLLLWRINW